MTIIKLKSFAAKVSLFLANCEKFILKNKYKVYILTFLYLVLVLLNHIPYLNVIFSQLDINAILLVGIVILFRPHAKIVFAGVQLGIALMFFYTLFNNQLESEKYGNYTYLLLLVAVVISIKEVLREN